MRMSEFKLNGRKGQAKPSRQLWCQLTWKIILLLAFELCSMRGSFYITNHCLFWIGKDFVPIVSGYGTFVKEDGTKQEAIVMEYVKLDLIAAIGNYERSYKQIPKRIINAIMINMVGKKMQTKLILLFLSTKI